jgi:hypothetical protein
MVFLQVEQIIGEQFALQRRDSIKINVSLCTYYLVNGTTLWPWDLVPNYNTTQWNRYFLKKNLNYRVLSKSLDVSLISGVEEDWALLPWIPVRIVDQDPLPECSLVHKSEMINLKNEILKNKNIFEIVS